MSTGNSPLNHLKVAAPCSSDWGDMIGNSRVRFCRQCCLNVYNLSGMSRRDAEALISLTEGRLCVRFYGRKDGTILMENCPVGLQAIKQRVLRIATAIIAAILSFMTGVSVFLGWRLNEPLESEIPALELTSPMQVQEPEGCWVKGQIAPPLPPTGPVRSRSERGTYR